MGMKRIFISQHHRDIKTKDFDIEVIQVAKVQDVLRNMFG